MDNELVKSKKEEIRSLYSEYQRMGYDKAVEMGRLLNVVKKEVGFGNFGAWIEENLPFSQQTAERYMGCYFYSIREEGSKAKSIEEGFEKAKQLKLIPHIPKTPPKPEILTPEMKKPISQVVEKTGGSDKDQRKVDSVPKNVEIPEAEVVDEQDDLVEDIKDRYVQLDKTHRIEVVSWISEQEGVEKKAA